jgi:hypothetical protein
MNKDDIQQIIDSLEPFLNTKMKETVAHAKVSFFKDDSNLAGHILDKMQGHIEKTIESKMKPLEEKLDDYIEKDTEDKKLLAQTLATWKEDITPVIEMGKNVQGFGKVSLYVLGFIASVTAGFYAIMELFKHK